MSSLNGLNAQRLISLPDSVRRHIIEPDPVLNRLYVSQIGYFPKASFHYHEREKSMSDNILIYCVRGKGWYMIKDQRFDMGPNEFIVLSATRGHISYGADSNDPWTIYSVHFSGLDVEVFNKRFEIGLNNGPRRILFNEKGLQLWETMYQNLEMGYSNENLSDTNLCLYHFIATFLFPDKHNSQKMKDTGDMVNGAIAYMRSKLGHMLSIKEMALNSDLSASHFSNLFHKATGMSPLEYFIRLQMDKDCIFLSHSDIKIKDIASFLGYEDPYYFSRLFKKQMNVSPYQYRTLRENMPAIKPPSESRMIRTLEAQN